MAPGRKTGGRDFKPGNPGKPKGARWKTPPTAKASIVAIMQDIVLHEPEAIRAALLRGLTASPTKSYAYLQLAAAYFDGKPKETLSLEGAVGVNLETARADLAGRLRRLAERAGAGSVADEPE